MADEKTPQDLLQELDRLVRRHSASGAPGAAELRAQLVPLREGLTRALAELSSEARLLDLAGDLVRLFAQQSGPREFARAALEAIAPALGASRAWVVTFQGEGDARDASALSASLLAEVGERPPEARGDEAGVSRSVLADVVRTGAAVLINDASDGPRSLETSVARLRLRSVLVAPLLMDGRVGGAIGVENATLAGAFVDSDTPRLTAVARLLAPCLEVGGRLDVALVERARLSEALAGGARQAGGIVGESPSVRALVSMLDRLRGSGAPVLVQGESGTGKELVARALHYSGRRAAGPLVTVNCAAIPEGLMESELFGHEKGAFTGATDRKRGKFEQAHHGTLFLDEVGELRLDLQAKLLRALQEQSFERVGGAERIQVDVRVIAATNRDLRARVAEGTFREDLFYRLHVVPLEVPPLRERPGDIRLLAEHFLAELAGEAGRAMTFAPDALAALERHSFPGNVRELRNLVHRLVALAPADRVTEADLPSEITLSRPVRLEKDPLRPFLRAAPATAEELRDVRTRMQSAFEAYVRELEEAFFRSVLERSGDNVSEAARLAGLNRTALHRKLKELGLR